LNLFDIQNAEISVIFRLKGGADTPDAENKVFTTIHPMNLNRPFFFDKDNTPNTWLLLLEFSLGNSSRNSFTKAQHLTAFLSSKL